MTQLLRRVTLDASRAASLSHAYGFCVWICDAATSDSHMRIVGSAFCLKQASFASEDASPMDLRMDADNKASETQRDTEDLWVTRALHFLPTKYLLTVVTRGRFYSANRMEDVQDWSAHPTHLLHVTSIVFAQSASAARTRKLPCVTSIAILSTRTFTLTPVALTQFSSRVTSSARYFSAVSVGSSRVPGEKRREV